MFYCILYFDFLTGMTLFVLRYRSTGAWGDTPGNQFGEAPAGSTLRKHPTELPHRAIFKEGIHQGTPAGASRWWLAGLLPQDASPGC